MSDNKRYHWLKLKQDFFEDDTIFWLEEQENGKSYVIFYLKLCLKSLQDNGQLIRYVGERLIPYDIKALAKLTNTATDTVAIAMKIFLEIGLVETLETGEIYMTQINEMIGSETDSARRVRKHRARKKALENSGKNKSLQCNSQVTKSNTELELEKDIDIEKELQQDKKINNTIAVDADYEPDQVNIFYQKNFSNLTEHIKEDLDKWIKDIGNELVLEALKRSVEAEKNYNYAKGIMKNWKRNSFKTIEDIKKQDEEYAKKKRLYSKNGKNPKKESLPKWIKEDYKLSDKDQTINDTELQIRLKKLREEERIT